MTTAIPHRLDHVVVKEHAASPAVAARRRFPYPYRALLAICSDLDLTPHADAYLASMRFLNTTAQTPSGPGVGLEVGNSIYFDMPPGHFSYWGTDDAGRAALRALMRSGHVDCIHSFGDLATTRAHAGRALEELDRHGCRLAVWVDHAVAPTNFGADRMRGFGDVPQAPAFHADLTCSYGVEYVWRGRVTSVIGQNAPPSLAGIYEPTQPLASLRTLAKEWSKGVVAGLGDRKYAMHAANDVLAAARLRSGHGVTEFLRSNPHWGGVSSCETGDGLPHVLTRRLLDRLTARRAVCILYTHLGKVADPSAPFNDAACAALRHLAGRQASGDVLVTTTRRALDYCRLASRVSARTTLAGGIEWVDIAAGAVSCDRQLDGLTVYVADPQRCRVRIDGAERTDILRNGPDETGRPSVSLPWRRLPFPL